MAKKRIELLAVEKSSTIVDHAGNGSIDPGDQLISTDDLFSDEVKIGHNAVVCTVVSAASSGSVEVQCQATLFLPEGQITGQGLVVDPGRPGKSTYDIAITGGTSTYRSARGHIHIVVVADGQTELTVHLT